MSSSQGGSGPVHNERSSAGDQALRLGQTESEEGSSSAASHMNRGQRTLPRHSINSGDNMEADTDQDYAHDLESPVHDENMTSQGSSSYNSSHLTEARIPAAEGSSGDRAMSLPTQSSAPAVTRSLQTIPNQDATRAHTIFSRHSEYYENAAEDGRSSQSRVRPHDERRGEDLPPDMIQATIPSRRQSASAVAQGEISTRDSHEPRGLRTRAEETVTPEFVLPRWQSDAEYIVRPPGSDISMPSSLLVDGLGSGYFELNGLSGGERVRLCNPCVPDPNTAPPQSPTPSIGANSPSSHHRSRSSLAGSHGVAHPSNRYGTVFTTVDGRDPLQYYARARSITMNPAAQTAPSAATSGHRMSAPDADDREALQQLMRRLDPSTRVSGRNRHSSYTHRAAASSSMHRALPPPPPLAEEDECPVCHRELPARSLPGFEALRETHINTCIQDHSTYGSPRRPQGEEVTPVVPRRSGMYVYAATEKDCVDDAECTICLEEFSVGIPMARLECLCRFHKSCISAWFVNHPGRCPVHQHDGFGF
ncbi:hypothetical protein QQS21_009422 [Conoideocrella luteorostrata]|uniref:RING-type E3 ubiquitin transferase n=1 Tax=Conoideocrella luteorostrata TaxID=1105319 RepID=A0AAJ0FXT8_9HYPO|nr:hypothetical protein QQS21_009422 [Conoideocrella luteorostrata]